MLYGDFLRKILKFLFDEHINLLSENIGLVLLILSIQNLPIVVNKLKHTWFWHQNESAVDLHVIKG